jgi:hypothetical protein
MAASGKRGGWLVHDADRARENRAYVRRLLRKTQPEFAAVLESLDRKSCPICQGTAGRAVGGGASLADANVRL